jgi:hypothetical protein
MKSSLFLIALGILISWLAVQAGLGLSLTVSVVVLGMLLSLGFAISAVQESTLIKSE